MGKGHHQDASILDVLRLNPHLIVYLEHAIAPPRAGLFVAASTALAGVG
jgi:hypothetical protein